MRARRHSKSGLFLIELMISVCFFSLTAAIFLRAFVQSHQVSKEAESLFKAQNLVSSVAEILEDSEDFTGDLKKYFPQLSPVDEGALLYYDKNWQPVTKNGVYCFSARWSREGEMWNVVLKVSDKKKKEIYGLTLRLYRPGGGGA